MSLGAYFSKYILLSNGVAQFWAVIFARRYVVGVVEAYSA
jgi:hypothetical protein